MRLCITCGVTLKGAASERACTSPAGIVHLRASATGSTYCGKFPGDGWKLGPVTA